MLVKHATTLLLMMMLSVFACAVHAATDSLQRHSPRPVRDLRYGKALYDFYQDRYFHAITDIMVAQARHPITKQGSDPQLLLGSLYLSYGMHEAAADIFKQLSSKDMDPYTHDLAWFYMGKMRYLDGQYDKALEALNSTHAPLDGSKYSERLYMMVNSDLHVKNYKEATKLLGQVDGDGIWDHYTRYNLGTALIRTGHIQEGINLLERISQLTPQNEEEYTLRDKANIAIGYTLLRHNISIDPTTPFSLVRLNGPFSSEALLGIGWAYSLSKRPEDALKPWMELSSRTTPASAHQEAMMAVAYALERLKQPRQALSFYTNIISDYDHTLSELDKALSDVDYIALLRNGISSRYMMRDKPSETEIPLKGLPAAAYIEPLILTRDFQQAYQNLLDVNELKTVIAKWRDKIPLLHIMLEERRRQYEINVARMKQSDYAARLKLLNQKRSVMANKLTDIERNQKIELLATRAERDRLQRLARIKRKLNALTRRGLDVNSETRDYRILYGLTQWKLYTDFPERLWQVKKGLRELDRSLTLASRNQSSLENILKIAPLNFDGFSRRISDIDVNLKRLIGKLNAVSKKQERYCKQLIIDGLHETRRQIDSRRNRALYAQARLYDQLSHRPESP